ncbi:MULTISPECIES: hypothetical protein [unclassified Aureimonas]|uniref:hypothetical protein n=1 Tax=unclassified Aureimonas TaxID=2615206 RepID=UPI00070F06CF|nr:MULTISPECIES: hypothetical protein [unclassified Aureimonas]KQT52253.1 hypothetical protein ASG62_16485 [Aureimonas sp. Leaf427]
MREFSARSPKILENGEAMQAGALASSLIRRAAGPRGHDEPLKALWHRLYEALRRRNDQWTERRVRALWAGEARRIEWDEIMDLVAVAELQEARRSHAEYVAETARVAALRVAAETLALGGADPACGRCDGPLAGARASPRDA